ncbi:hypothetical protein [Rhodopseudomonas boonkerdii]|nr:hypothetical protein [Rhodopseudomonas boonkerdii]
MFGEGSIVVWVALGLFLVPIIFLALGLHACSEIKDPKDYH